MEKQKRVCKLSKRITLLLVIVAGFGLCLTAGAASYYCDPVNGSMTNSGTSLSPWSTLEAVFSAGKRFSGGDAIYLRSGYHGCPSVKGTNTAAVLIAPDTGASPLLGGLTVSYAANWTVSGLDICPENAGAGNYLPGGKVVYFTANAHDITLQDCVVRSALDINGWSFAEWTNRIGKSIAIYSYASNTQIVSNWLQNVGFGIALDFAATNSGLKGNVIENFLCDGIRVLSDNSICENNVVMNNYGDNIDYNHDDCFQSWSRGEDGVAGHGTIRNVIVRGNMFISQTDPNQPLSATSMQGIGCFDGMYENWTVENNLIVVPSAHGINLGGALNCKVVNNTVIRNPYIDSTASTSIRVTGHKDDTNGLPWPVASTNNLVRNNLTHYPVAIATNIGVSDHNLPAVTMTSSDYTNYFADYMNLDFSLKATSFAVNAGVETEAPTNDIIGCSRTVPYDVGAYESTNIVPVPSAGLTASPSSGTVPLTVSFTDVSSGMITNRYWSFGDGTTTNTTLTSLQHIYAATGSYTAQLTVSGTGGSDSDSLNITVIPEDPVAATNLIANVNDQLWRSDGTAAWVGSATARVGTESSGVRSGIVLPFWIPALNGSQITNAELSISLPNSTGLSDATGAANMDVYGVRSDSSSSVTSSNDLTTGTLVVDNWLNISPSLTVGEKTVSSASLAAWISAQVGTAGGKYVFITVRPDALDNSYHYATVNMANATSNRPHLLLTCAVPVTDPVHLDLSGSYDYDAFVTGEEITYATAQTNEVRNVIGDHAVKFYTVSARTGIAHLVNPGGTYSGIASNGIVNSNGFELAKGLTAKFGTASGSAKVNNSIAVLPDGVSTSFSRTVTLASADQRKYSSLNLLVNGDRKLSASSSATLSVKYVGDSTWYTVWTETAAANTAGGCFGGTLDGVATYSNQSGAWTQVAVSDANGAVKVSNGLTVAGSGSSYMYKFTTPVSLDNSKVLESFKMETTTSNKSYVNDVFLYAATATP